MSASPLTAKSDLRSLPELLCSESAVFVWNDTTGAVVWANSSARQKIGTDTYTFAATFSKATRRRLKSFSAPTRKRKPLDLKIKIGASDVHFSAQPIEVAGGGLGLVLTEKLPQIDGAPVQPETPVAKHALSSPRKVGKGAPTQVPVVVRSPLPTLNADEMRSFKAIGRKVRKLCRDKLQLTKRVSSPDGVIAKASKRVTKKTATVTDPLRMLLPIFDLFAVFDRQGCILKVEGTPQKLGWQKKELVKSNIAGLLPDQMGKSLQKIISKITMQSIRHPYETIDIKVKDGTRMPCRMVLGRWHKPMESFFMAVITHQTEQRSKNRQTKPTPEKSFARLAA